MSLTVRGKLLSPKISQEYVYRFDGNQLVVTRNGKLESKGAFSLDPTKSPPWFDLAENSKVMVFGVYRMEGDKLTLSLHEQTRPLSFESPPAYIVIVLERTTP